MTSKQLRKLYGLGGKPIQATRVFVKPMDHDFGTPANTLLIVNDQENTFTSANVYGGNLGRNFDAECMTHPLPAPDSPKWKSWTKAGYAEGHVDDWECLQLIDADGEEVRDAEELATA